jgi:RHS repeat-associated protein
MSSKLTAICTSARFPRKGSMRMRWRLRPGAGRGTPVTSWVLGAFLLASGGLAQTTFTTRYTYDADGNRTSIIYPSGNVVTYSFDYADRPSSAAAGSTPLVTSAAYLPFGPETQVVYGNGTTKTMVYDSRYRVQQNKLTGPAGVIAQYDYQEDAAGNITQIHDATDPGFNRDFAYDDLQRLVTANSGASLWGAGSYSYDAMGNMLSTSVAPAKTFSYLGTTPKLLAVATAGVSHSLSYDAVGNETGYIANRTYSARNELLSVTDSTPAGHTIAYGYDGRGIRVTRAESPVGTGTARSVFTYSPELSLLGVVRDDGPSYDIDWFGGRPVAQSGGAGLRYTFTDHLGTPILQTDATGAIVWRAEYEPYGDVRQLRAGAATEQPLRLPGQEVAMTSEGSEENYNIYRFYRSPWGRYSQVDPLGLQAGANLYRYADESPITMADPLGLLVVIKRPNSSQSTEFCDGKGGFEIQIDDRFSDEELRCFGDCLALHETQHALDFSRATAGRICRGQLFGAWPIYGGRPNQAQREEGYYEQRADQVELDCLRQKRNCACKALVDYRIRQVTADPRLAGRSLK